MRIHRNGSPYDKFTPEQQVMGDKAESLGYTWDRVKYPTPAWSISFDLVQRNRPQFNIPRDVWNREICLWVLACVEKILPVWENWAVIGSPETLDVPRSDINAAKNYVNGGISRKEFLLFQSYSSAAYYTAQYRLFVTAHAPDAAAANLAARSAVTATHAADSDYTSFAETALTAANASPNKDAEQEWQRAALAQRIDVISPWRLQ